GFVYAHHRDDAHAINSKRGVNSATRERLSEAVAHRGLHGIPSGRQAQAEVEPFGVDGFNFPGPIIGAARAMISREAGHAGQRHGWTIAYCAVPAALPLALRLLRGVDVVPAVPVAEPRVAAGPCASEGAAPLFCPVSVTRSRATFF